MINFVKKTFLLYIMFISIYAVNVRPLYNYYLLIVIAAVYILLNLKAATNFTLLSLKPILFILIAGFYALIIDQGSIDGSSYGIVAIRIIFECFGMGFFVAHLARRWTIPAELIVKFFILIGFIQTLFVIYMIINFAGKGQFLVETLGFAEDDLLVASYVGAFRGYGLSMQYLFAFPFVQGLIAAISLFLMLNSKSIFWILINTFSIIVNMIVISLNARIGFLPLSLSLFTIPVIFCFSGDYKKLIRMAIYGALLAAILISFVQSFSENDVLGSAFIRVEEGFTAITANSESSSEQDDQQRELYKEYWHFPNGYDFLVGTGVKLSGESPEYTDFGYPRFLFFGGLPYSFFMYLGFSYIFIGIFRNLIRIVGDYDDQNSKAKLYCGGFISVLVISYLVAQIKGEIFGLNDAVRFLVLLYSFMVFYSPKKITKLNTTKLVI